MSAQPGLNVSISPVFDTNAHELREAAQPDLGSQVVVCLVVRDLTPHRAGGLI